MKNKVLFLGLLLGAVLSGPTWAYNSPVGSDPKNANYDVEYKYVVKSTVAGESGAVAAGDIVTYSSAYDGYTVTNMLGANTVPAQNAIACVAAEAIASGDIAYHPCVSRGYVDYLKFDAALAGFTIFDHLCVTGSARAAPCTRAKVTPGTDGSTGTATAAFNKIKALQTKAGGAGTGATLKAFINIP